MKAKGNLKKESKQVPSSTILNSPKFHLALITGCAILLYLPSLTYKLTYYDDTTLIENISEFTRQGNSFLKVFSQSVFGFSPGSGDFFYRPCLRFRFTWMRFFMEIPWQVSISPTF
jgi:hypothetical protein